MDAFALPIMVSLFFISLYRIHTLMTHEEDKIKICAAALVLADRAYQRGDVRAFETHIHIAKLCIRPDSW